jgi:integrase/recombinase XerD
VDRPRRGALLSGVHRHTRPQVGLDVPAPIAGAIRGYLDHLAVERGASRHTLAAYRRDLARYAQFLAERGLDAPDQVGAALVADFLADLRRGRPSRSPDGPPAHPPLAASSAARTVVAVRGLHRFLQSEGITKDNPAAEVKPPRPPMRLPKAVSVEVVERLIEAAGFDGTELAVRDRGLLELLYGTGARISEAVGLDVDDVDLSGGSLLLRGKGGKQRLVPLGSYARRAVQRYLDGSRPRLVERGHGTPALWLNARGGRLSRQSAWAVLQAAAEKAGVREPVSPHTLRHSFATHLLDGGADVRVVQELLGHASVTTTQLYTLVTIDSLREAYAAAHPRSR